MVYHDKAIANTFGLKAVASNWVEYGSAQELAHDLASAPKPYLHVGGGSNLLFAAERIEGTVFHNGCKDIEMLSRGDKTVLVRAGGGLAWDDFVLWCVENRFYGAENLSLIPGEVGAAAVQNIGAYGAEVKDIIESVETYDVQRGCLKRFSTAECAYAYRSSFFKTDAGRNFFVLAVEFRLSLEAGFNLSYGPLKELDNPTLESVRAKIVSTRKAKLPDPEEVGSAGSFFMNPVVPRSQYEALAADYPDMPHYPAGEGFVKLSAGWMIDRCGFKGCSRGGAGVYEHQALVLVNRGGATAAGITALAEEIIASVSEKFGVTLRPEVQIVK